MKITFFAILLSASINVGLTQPKIKAHTQSTENVTVPDFKDARAKAYYNWHKTYLQKYLQAVRQNDKATIKSVFDEGKSKTSEALAVLQLLQKNEGEYKKMLEYGRQIAPVMREISKSAYVQQLTNEYMKNHK